MLSIDSLAVDIAMKSVVTDVLVLSDGGEVVDQEEVEVVGGPAHDEDGDDHGEHDDDPLLVLPALVKSGRGDQDQLQYRLVSSVQMEAHLGIAQSHTNCGQDVRGQEETEIVSLNIFYIKIMRRNSFTCSPSERLRDSRLARLEYKPWLRNILQYQEIYY